MGGSQSYLNANHGSAYYNLEKTFEESLTRDPGSGSMDCIVGRPFVMGVGHPILPIPMNVFPPKPPEIGTPGNNRQPRRQFNPISHSPIHFGASALRLDKIMSQSEKSDENAQNSIVDSVDSEEVEKMAVKTLKELFGLKIRPATSRVVLRVRPWMAAQSEDSSWVTMDYSYNHADGKEVFTVESITGTFDSLLTPEAKAAIQLEGGLSNKEIRVRIFFTNLDYFINNLEGTLWWNGFLVALDGHPKTRLALADFEMDPLRLVFHLKGVCEVETLRTKRRVELIAKPVDGGMNRSFKIRGLEAPKIQIRIPKPKTMILSFPPYFSCMD